INDVFSAAGVSATLSRNVQLVATATALVFFDVTVIDNQSGDSVFALQSADEGGPTFAPNLLTNGRFDTNTAGWTPTSADYSVSFSALDADGQPSSGSALVTNAVQGAVAAAGIRQCVTVNPSTKYHLVGKARILPGQA